MADKRLDQTTNASAVAAADNIPFVTAAGVTSYVTGDELAASGPFSSRYAPVNGAWTSWTPTITAGSGTITTATASSCSYLKNGSLFVAEGFITITTAGTGAGLLLITLPAGVTWTGYTGGTYCGGFYEGNSGTFGSSVTVGTGEVAFANNNGTTIISSGATVRFQIFGQVS